MNNFRIRKCTSNDVEAVRNMQIEWAEANITYGFVPSTNDDLLSKLGDYFLVAEMDETVIGFVYGSVQTSEDLAVIPAGDQYFEIDDIYVKPGLRHLGFGGMLLDSLLNEVKANGIHRFLLYSASKDIDGIINFYRKHGFNSWYVQMFI